MVTIKDIQDQLAGLGKPITRQWVYHWLKRAKVQPVTRAVRPVLYPDDTGAKIIGAMGLELGQDGKRVLTLSELKNARKD